MAIMGLKGKTAVTAGLVGGTIAIASLILNWMSITMIKAASSVSANASGVDLILGSTIRALKLPERHILGIGIGLKEMAIVVLIGGILSLVGGTVTIVTRKKVVSLLMPIGGILMLLAGVWSLSVVMPSKIEFLKYLTDQIQGEKIIASAGYGVYASIVGAIFAVIGSLSLSGDD
jgi:hypothetical protein